MTSVAILKCLNFNGCTPASVMLKASEGYFKKASYQVKFTKEGYEEKVIPLTCKVDGWYFGNIVFGGLIGFLIVDPATGAMYKFDTELLHETLTRLPTSENEPQLKIDELSKIPANWKEHLVLLETRWKLRSGGVDFPSNSGRQHH